MSTKKVFEDRTEWRNADGKLHRIDGPAIEWFDEIREWYLNGLRHRVDGPAIERPEGYKQWRQNGKLHREDGPAIEYANGSKCWYQDGLLHRLDGPAIEKSNGYRGWFLESRLLTKEEHALLTWEHLSQEKQDDIIFNHGERNERSD